MNATPEPGAGTASLLVEDPVPQDRMRTTVSNATRRDLDLPMVTLCVLTYGDYLHLVRRTIESIRRHCPRSEYRLLVGADAVGDESLAYLRLLAAKGAIDELIVSPDNLCQSPMMRRMFAGIQTELIWWFD